mmetsp:Transcript_11357/g.47512  ORF Transcript_11357/g.47512 Transcript_11357/m.47512 type:complete len:306 (+) Transcript_11357:808-1725(+)
MRRAPLKRDVVRAVQVRRRHRRDPVPPRLRRPTHLLIPLPDEEPRGVPGAPQRLHAQEPFARQARHRHAELRRLGAVGLDVGEDAAGLVHDPGDVLGYRIERRPERHDAPDVVDAEVLQEHAAHPTPRAVRHERHAIGSALLLRRGNGVGDAGEVPVHRRPRFEGTLPVRQLRETRGVAEPVGAADGGDGGGEAAKLQLARELVVVLGAVAQAREDDDRGLGRCGRDDGCANMRAAGRDRFARRGGPLGQRRRERHRRHVLWTEQAPRRCLFSARRARKIQSLGRRGMRRGETLAERLISRTLVN